MQDKVNRKFEKLKRTISKDIAKLQKQEFDTKSAICDSCIDVLKNTVAEIQDVSDQGSPTQQLIMSQNFKGKIAELKTQAEKVSEELKDVVLKFDFDDSLKLPPAKHALPGKLEKNFIGAPELSSRVMSQQNKLTLNLKLGASTDLEQGEFDEEDPLLSGLDFLPDGRLLTVDSMNKKCVVFNQNLKKLNTFALSKVPHGLVVVSEDEVAIATEDGYKLIFLKISKLNEIRVVRECDVKKKFQSICVIDNDSVLVGCIDDPQPVRVVSMKGEERELRINIHTKSYPRDSIACTYIRNRNKVVVTDRFAHTVYIFDKANFTRVEVKDERIIKEPRGVAVGPADCIFVCSVRTNSLVRISHTGQILSSHVLDMKFPYSICVSNDNTRLAVSCASKEKSKLQLFSIELTRE